MKAVTLTTAAKKSLMLRFVLSLTITQICLSFPVSEKLFCLLTCEDVVDTSSCEQKVVQAVRRWGGLPGTTAPHEHHGLVPPSVQQVTVGDLGRRIDVRRQVFLLASSEHLYELEQDMQVSQLIFMVSFKHLLHSLKPSICPSFFFLNPPPTLQKTKQQQKLKQKWETPVVGVVGVWVWGAEWSKGMGGGCWMVTFKY